MSATFIATAAEAYVRQCIAELRGLDPQLTGLSLLAPGILRFTVSVRRGEFLSLLQNSEPVFVRHVHPVDTEVALEGRPADLGRLSGQVADLLGQVSGQTVSVQVRRCGTGDLPYDRADVRERLDTVVTAIGGQPATQGAALILSATLAD